MFIFPACKSGIDDGSKDDRIQPYLGNTAFWQYKNEPVLLLGGSSNDNIFQHEYGDLAGELDKLIKFGGNYLRNTMSSRDPGDLYPFAQDSLTGLFDLGHWNGPYWKRFEDFLEITGEKDIIVQIEVWATYDFYTRASHVIDGRTSWDRNPFNPVNNINYTEGESGFFATFRSNGQEIINPFFNTVLPLHQPFDFSERPIVLGYQQMFVDKLLSISLNYDHVLYCIDNETQADPKWSRYWAQYIREKANEHGKTVEITEMFDPFDPSGGAVEGARMQSPATHFFTLRSNVHVTIEDAVNYSFIEVSNHNAQVGEPHYNTGLYVWNKIQESGHVRPLNNVKIYGAAGGTWNGTDKDGIERFWRNIFSGAAAVRFHRQPSGLGNSVEALAHIRSMRLLTDAVDIFSCRPANGLLSDRLENEAFLLENSKGEHLIYFPTGGQVHMDFRSANYEIRWLDTNTAEWLDADEIKLPGIVQTPDQRMWAARIVRLR